MGPLHYSGTSGKLECDYCDSKFDVSEIETIYREKNERAAKAEAAQADSRWNTAALSEDWDGYAEKMKSYICPSCGAELICDETTAATCCPYCGNQTIIPGQFSGALKPEYVIPFKTDRAMAIAALKAHYKGKALLPKSFADSNHIEKIQGVYVPFWMFDAVAEGEMSFHATKTTSYVSSREEIVTTKHYDIRRGGRLAFEKVPVDASSRMPDGHMDSIEPFDYSELKPFSMAFMPGFLADKYDVDAKSCGERMQQRCSEAMEESLTGTVSGYDSKTVTEKRIIVKKGDVHYAMLPVWMLATKWKDQSFLFAMNGQSGRLVGDLPVDRGKYWGFFGGISAVLMVIMLFINYFVMSAPMTGLSMALFCIITPILIGLLTVSVLASQLKSISTRSAGGYVSGSGLALNQKSDRFTHSTVRRIPISTRQKR